ncbi:uncharacterized protein LOC116842447 [Odontomachus brunneus]|uniref:uncharacterized protein LOC116842447 n=1 Tax=Odontomachus brunneus TaxID=486640 RepID=UPI0013F233B1|nr:uncharacterized protein LOC116842447 [Odontomachus brunneus]
MPLEHTLSRTRQQESEPNADTHEQCDQSMELESVGMTNPTVGQLSLYTTALQLPSFCKENPAIWFQQAEMAFALHRITSDEKKFRYIALHLDNTTLPFVIDLLSSPPAQERYEAIKNRILASFGGTQESKLRKLDGFKMGDEKPSNFLHRLRNLASGQCTDTVLWTLFMKKLPKNIRAALIISSSYPIRDLDKLATQADKIHEIIKQHHSVAVATNTSSEASPPRNQQIGKLRAMIESLFRDVWKGRPCNRSRTNYQLETSSQLLIKGAFVLVMYTFSLIALTFTYNIFVRSSWSWT